MKNASNNDLKSTRTARSGSVGYTTVANAMPASQEAAPYLGQTHVSGSYTQDDVANRIASSKGAHCGAEEVKRVLNAVGNYLLDHMSEELCSFDIGFAHVRPAIGGKFPSMDAAFDASRNRIYVLATPSAEIKDALASGSPTRMDSVGDEPEIGNVTWGGKSQTLKSGEPFDVLGNALTLDVGDESAELLLPDETSVSVSMEAKTPGNWQRLVGRLAHAVEACEGAVLVVRTHGYDADSGLKTVKFKPLTVVAGDAPPPEPVPTITSATTQGMELDHIDGDGEKPTFIQGNHLDYANVPVAAKDGDDNVVFTGTGNWSDASNSLEVVLTKVGDPQTGEGELTVTTPGGTATHVVTFGE